MEIKRVNGNVDIVLNVIKHAYKTVADKFEITKENGTTNPAFIESKHLPFTVCLMAKNV